MENLLCGCFVVVFAATFSQLALGSFELSPGKYRSLRRNKQSCQNGRERMVTIEKRKNNSVNKIINNYRQFSLPCGIVSYCIELYLPLRLQQLIKSF